MGLRIGMERAFPLTGLTSGALKRRAGLNAISAACEKADATCNDDPDGAGRYLKSEKMEQSKASTLDPRRFGGYCTVSMARY